MLCVKGKSRVQAGNRKRERVRLLLPFFPAANLGSLRGASLAHWLAVAALLGLPAKTKPDGAASPRAIGFPRSIREMRLDQKLSAHPPAPSAGCGALAFLLGSRVPCRLHVVQTCQAPTPVMFVLSLCGLLPLSWSLSWDVARDKTARVQIKQVGPRGVNKDQSPAVNMGRRPLGQKIAFVRVCVAR